MAVDTALVSAIREGLAALGDPEKAPQMQAYMKSAMPYRGVQKPARAALLREVFRAHPPVDRRDWLDTVLELWRGAAYREERYAAIDLTGHRAARPWQRPDLLGFYDELIVTGAWWDYVDELAIRRVGPILLESPDLVTPVLRAWSVDDDLWRRRTAIICQVGAKTATDTDLLTEVIEPNIADRDFFIRKGIGWALRAYAWAEPEWVRAFVAAHPDLSVLSRREALKNVGAA